MYNQFKQILRLLPAGFMAVACSSPAQQGTSESPAGDSIMTPFDKAAKYYMENRPFDEVMAEQQLAVKQLREGHPQNDATEILSQTGHFYMRHGDYLEALTYLQEAADSLNERSRQTGHPQKSAIRLHGTFGALLSRFGLFEEALKENTLGLQASAANGYADASDIWRIRTAIYNDMLATEPANRKACLDSLLYAADMAEKVVALMEPSETDEIYRKRARFVKGELFVNYPDEFADSLQLAADYIGEALEKPKVMAESAKVLLGRVKTMQGDIAGGIALSEEGLEDFRREDDREGVEWALSILADSYVDAGDGSKLLKAYPHVIAIRDTLAKTAKINDAIGADYRYRLKEARQAQAQLAKEKTQARRMALYLGLALLTGLFGGAAAMGIGARLLRKAKEEKENLMRTINDILKRQQTLNATIEELNGELSRQHEREQGEDAAKAAIILNPTLLCKEDENAFRRAFARLHPYFLKQLRTDFPTLTPNDDLVCMLIYLRNPSIDIALCLGISRPSLNSVRYRIRKKMGIDKETDLDAFICKR